MRPVLALPLAASALLAACAPRPTSLAPVPGAGFALRDARSMAPLTPAQLADSASRVRVVLFGELHDDAGAHAAQQALLEALAARDVPVILSLEMFERDVQPALDAWLAGTLSDSAFRATSRPWPNYATDYRPALELAKRRRWPVLAANVPRTLASATGRAGLALLDTLAVGPRAYIARSLDCPTTDDYHARFVATMSGGGGTGGHGGPAMSPAMIERFYQAQCVKDETMAEAIADALGRAAPGTVVVHLNGAFHSDLRLGTASRVLRRVPQATMRTLTTVPLAGDARTIADSVRARADWLVLTPARTPPAP
jgi:uncharacterized iron-regulated protein